MGKLYEDIVSRNATYKEENEKILSAYDKILKEQYMLDEDSTEDALKTLKAIIGSTKDSGGDINKMANGMMKSYKKNKGFSKDQAQWIYKTSKGIFKK